MKYNKEWLLNQETVENDFLFFWGHQKQDFIIKSCLSQWYECEFSDLHSTYTSMEQYMMAKKALLFDDIKSFDVIMNVSDPKVCKALGRKILNFDNETWDKYKTDIVVNGNMLKFSQNKKLKDFLLCTGNKVLVEASPYDKIWGIGMYQSDINSINPLKWNGLNLLGFCLIEVRDIINKSVKIG